MRKRQDALKERFVYHGISGCRTQKHTHMLPKSFNLGSVSLAEPLHGWCYHSQRLCWGRNATRINHATEMYNCCLFHVSLVYFMKYITMKKVSSDICFVLCVFYLAFFTFKVSGSFYTGTSLFRTLIIRKSYSALPLTPILHTKGY